MRLVFDPVDFLAVSVEEDPVLNYRIGAGASGHDDWGFRNRDVPDSADILTIGDSMTYGVMAKSFESWPAKLEDILGVEVYNASLGGYGPLHYLHILRTRAPDLSPEKVVVMLYLGNDIMDTYNLAYSNDNWTEYRTQGSTDTVDAELFLPKPGKVSFSKRVRNWLAGRSVLYRIATQNALFDGARQQQELDKSSTAIVYEHLGGSVVLDANARLSFTAVDDARIQEGMRIIEQALADIASFTQEQGMALHVAIMPVREHVFFRINDDVLANDPDMQKLDENLVALQSQLEAVLTQANISYTDLRPVMEKALDENMIYPPTDGHPNAAGYAVVAEHLAPLINSLTVSN